MTSSTRKRIGAVARRLSESFLGPALNACYNGLQLAHYRILCVGWHLRGRYRAAKKPDAATQVAQDVTFIYKSFERQKKARRLFRSIQAYYPGVSVIIADDSATPLVVKPYHGVAPTIIQLPFNSGISLGLSQALAQVTTPYVMRLDDDFLFTPFTRVDAQLAFLAQHPQVDLCALQTCNALGKMNPQRAAARFERFSMSEAPRPLLIPHLTAIDPTHIVMGKVANCFVARTNKLRLVGYDPNIRMIDHHEFFYRAAGVLVSVVDTQAFVFHYGDRLNAHYAQYRGDVEGDLAYIRAKRAAERGAGRSAECGAECGAQRSGGGC